MPGRQTEPGGAGCEQEVMLGGVDRRPVGGRDGGTTGLRSQPQGWRPGKGRAWWAAPLTLLLELLRSLAQPLSKQLLLDVNLVQERRFVWRRGREGCRLPASQIRSITQLSQDWARQPGSSARTPEGHPRQRPRPHPQHTSHPRTSGSSGEAWAGHTLSPRSGGPGTRGLSPARNFPMALSM